MIRSEYGGSAISSALAFAGLALATASTVSGLVGTIWTAHIYSRITAAARGGSAALMLVDGDGVDLRRERVSSSMGMARRVATHRGHGKV